MFPIMVSVHTTQAYWYIPTILGIAMIGLAFFMLWEQNPTDLKTTVGMFSLLLGGSLLSNGLNLGTSQVAGALFFLTGLITVICCLLGYGLAWMAVCEGNEVRTYGDIGLGAYFTLLSTWNLVVILLIIRS